MKTIDDFLTWGRYAVSNYTTTEGESLAPLVISEVEKGNYDLDQILTGWFYNYGFTEEEIFPLYNYTICCILNHCFQVNKVNVDSQA